MCNIPRVIRHAIVLVLVAFAPATMSQAQDPWNMRLLDKITATDGQSNERMGQSLSASNGRVLAGSGIWDQPNGPAIGAARVFVTVGNTLQQEATLPLSDQGPGDSFGLSVGLDGDVAVVGAPRHDALGPDTGAAYVFRRQADGTWAQEAKLVDPTPDAGALWGYSVAVSGNRIVVGSYEDDTWAALGGSATIFEFDGVTWNSIVELGSGQVNAGDRFGTSVSLDGDLLAIGASTRSTGGSGSGAAYIFRRSASGNWDMEQAIFPCTAFPAGCGEGLFRSFGYSIAIQRDPVAGDVMISGANWGEGHQTSELSGRAFVYRKSAGDNWFYDNQMASPQHPSPSLAADQFGFAVAIEGDFLAVGGPNIGHTPWTGTQYWDGSGIVRVYENIPSGPSMNLIQPDPLVGTGTPGVRTGGWFGTALAFDGNRLYVGKSGDGDVAGQSGAIYIYEVSVVSVDPLTTTLLDKVTASDGQSNELLGESLSASNGRVLVGSRTWDQPSGPAIGAARVFVAVGNTLVQEATLPLSDQGPGDSFGHSVGLDGDLAVAGAPRHDAQGPDAGAAYVFRRQQDGTWVEETKLVDPTPDPGALWGYSVAVSGNRIVVGAYEDDTWAVRGGSATIFEFDGVTWNAIVELGANEVTSDDRFGTSVSLDGELLAIGASTHSTGGAGSGAAYVYRRDSSSGVWNMEQAFFPCTAMPAGCGEGLFGSFGYSIAIQRDPVAGDVMISGGVWGQGHLTAQLSGRAFVYRRPPGGNWDYWYYDNQMASPLHPAPSLAADLFGYAVAVEGRLISVGGPNIGHIPWTGTQYWDGYGVVRVYDNVPSGSSMNLVQPDPFVGAATPNVRTGGWFGAGLAFDGNRLYVGKPGDGDAGMQAGAIYVYGVNATTPIADAGDDQSVEAGDLVVLDGTGSFDATTTALQYSWSFIQMPTGSSAMLADSLTAAPSFVADVAGEYVIELMVTDDHGLSSEPDQVAIQSLLSPVPDNSITFDELDLGSPTFVIGDVTFSKHQMVLTEDGFNIRNDITGFLLSEDSTGNKFTAGETGNTTVIERADGQAFDLLSIDLRTRLGSGSGAMIVFKGFLESGAIVTRTHSFDESFETYLLDFRNIIRLTFQHAAFPANPDVDNIVYQYPPGETLPEADAIIVFDGLPLDPPTFSLDEFEFSKPPSLTEGHFQFQNDFGDVILTVDSAGNKFFAGAEAHATTVMERIDGKAFDVLSLDLRTRLGSGASSSMEFVGELESGVQVARSVTFDASFRTYWLDLRDLVRLTFRHPAFPNNPDVDNIAIGGQPASDLFVVEYAGGVTQYDKSDAIGLSFATGQGSISILADEGGMYYISEQGSGAIVRYDQSGNPLPSLVEGNVFGLGRLELGPEGHIWAAGQASIPRYNLQGELVSEFFTGIDGLYIQDMAFDNQGHVFFLRRDGVNDPEIQMYELDGDFVFTVASKPGWFGNLELGPNNQLYVSSSDGVEVVDPATGAISSVVVDFPGPPEDIEFDPNGRLYVTSDVLDAVIAYEFHASSNTWLETRRLESFQRPSAVLFHTPPSLDVYPPVLSLIGDEHVFIEFGSSFVDPGTVAVDAVDGNISTGVVFDDSAINLSVPGVYPVNYSVSDSAGNSSSITRYIHVTSYKNTVIYTISNASITEYDLYTGAELNSFGNTGTPEGIIVDDAGFIYVARSFDGIIERYDQNGNELPVFADVFGRAGKIEWDPDGLLWMTNTTIPRYDISGYFVDDFFVHPFGSGVNDFAFDDDGHVYFVIYEPASSPVGRIEKWDMATKSHLETIAEGSFNGHIAIDANDHLYVKSFVNGEGLLKYDLSGNLLDNLAGDRFVGKPRFDADGYLYTIAGPQGNEVIRVYNPAGEIIRELPAPNARSLFVSNKPQVDTDPPILKLLGANPLTWPSGTPYLDPGFVAVDARDGDVTSLVTVDSSALDSTNVGQANVVLSIIDAAGNEAHITRTINLVDTVPPVITLNGPANLVIECGIEDYQELGATATDNADPSVSVVVGGDIVDSNIVGTYSITYDATDLSGNLAMQVTRSVQVGDTTPPSLSLQGDSSYSVLLGSVYVDPGAVAMDACDGDITSSIVVDFSGVDTSVAGNYEVLFEVSDASGNMQTASRSVNVIVPSVMTIELRDSFGELITNSGAALEYRLAGTDTFVNFGDGLLDSNGRESIPIVDGRHRFRLSFAGATQTIRQDVNEEPVVVFQTHAIEVVLRDSSGFPITEDASIDWQPRGSGDYIPFGDGLLDGTGLESMEVLPLRYRFRVHYEGSSQSIRLVDAEDTQVEFQTTLVELQFRDHNSEPFTLSNASVSWQPGSSGDYQPFASGIIGADGTASMEVLPVRHRFQIDYQGATMTVRQDVAVDPVVVFQTVLSIIELRDSSGALITDSDAQVTWQPGNSGDFEPFATGVLSSEGTAFMEVLPVRHRFRLLYQGAQQTIRQNMSLDPVVLFQTILTTVELRDSNNNLITDSGALITWQPGNTGEYVDFGDGLLNSNGTEAAETLPVRHRFRLETADGETQTRRQNVGQDSVVIFVEGVQALLANDLDELTGTETQIVVDRAVRGVSLTLTDGQPQSRYFVQWSDDLIHWNTLSEVQFDQEGTADVAFISESAARQGYVRLVDLDYLSRSLR